MMPVVDTRSDRVLRRTFDEVPELYDRARPVYPPSLFDDLVELAEIPTTGRVVEIGCGTGQATLPRARRGLEIRCVELGEGLAAVARRRLKTFPTVEVINAPFETWVPTEADFDAVVAFTAFHWIDPDVRYQKSAALLRDGGRLAVIETQHVLPEDGDSFFADVQADYEVMTPDDPKTKAGGPPKPDDVGDLRDEMEGSGLFANFLARRYTWDVIYTADEYIDVLDTYSGHRALDDATRRRLYSLIRQRIQERPGGKVRKTYLATMNIAKARSTANWQ
jgi:SAM-dependent methyltransferase